MNAGINTLQLIMVMTTSVGIMVHVIIIPLLLQASGRDSWISVSLAGVLLLGWMVLIYYIIKKTNQQNMYLWLKQRVGSIMTKMICVLLSVYLFSTSYLTLKDTITWSIISYLPLTPNFALTLLLSIVCFYLAVSGLRTIAIVTGVALPIVVILGFFVMFSNFPHKDYTLLTPIMVNGIVPVFKGMVYVGAIFVEVLLLIFVQHYVKTKINFWALFCLGLLFIMLTLSPLIGAIVEFGPSDAKTFRYPAFEEWKLVAVTRYIEHVDFLSIYQWFTGSVIRIALCMFLIPELFNLSKGAKRTWVLGLLFGLLVLLNSTLPLSDIQFLTILYDYYFPGVLAFLMLLTLVIGSLVIWKQRKKVVKT